MGRTINLNTFVVIGEENYCITLFSPTKALKLLTRLTKMVGEPMAVMAATADGKSPLELLPQAVKALMERMDDEGAVISLITNLLECVTKDKKAINIDLEFQGRLGDMMKLLSKVVEVQFEDFYAALGESLQGVEPAQKESAAPQA